MALPPTFRRAAVAPHPAPAGGGLGHWLIRWLPAVVLISGVLAYGAAFVAADAIGGKGPGFTMYSAADTEHTRFVRIEALVGDDFQPAWVPAGADDLMMRAIALPSDGNLEELARTFLEERWVVDGPWLVAAPEDPVGPDRVGERPVEALRLTMWATEIHDDVMTPFILNQVVVSTGESR